MITRAPASVFDRLTALADSTRSRLLTLLERNELTVSELCAAVQLPQSTVSRHLKVLSDDGWVSSRAEGTSRFYRMEREGELDQAAQGLWGIVRDQIAESPAGRQDALRLKGVLAERRLRSEEFFSSSAGQWDAVRQELFGERAVLTGMLGLVDDAWTVADLGCGTGQLAATIAPFVRRVIGVDASPAMLAAARKRMASLENVELRAGELEALPIGDREADAAMMSLVLHFVPDPRAALGEAARVLAPGGRLVIVDMMPHTHDEYRQQMGHVWQGFSEAQLTGWLSEAGFDRVRYMPLPADADAKGPVLFAAVGRRADASRTMKDERREKDPTTHGAHDGNDGR
jgi:ubiquinone/menaquinone biosynthesis C-methylase UbiE/DNA-binding transcriptional ArsR family regulator